MASDFLAFAKEQANTEAIAAKTTKRLKGMVIGVGFSKNEA